MSYLLTHHPYLAFSFACIGFFSVLFLAFVILGVLVLMFKDYREGDVVSLNNQRMRERRGE